jgi:XTP/dITP diphosphohydrolase
LNAIALVCASANPHKVAEIAEIFGDAVTLLPRPAAVPDVVEDAETLEGNARLKATTIARATGHPAVADDTGLEVDALAGAPGVFSARYAGPAAADADNRAKLLAELAELGDAGGSIGRSARFRTVVIVAWPNGDEVVSEGVCEGTIADDERGSAGFGYDALFVPADGDGRTFAEMNEDDKHAISHRGRAFRALLEALVSDRPPAGA